MVSWLEGVGMGIGLVGGMGGGWVGLSAGRRNRSIMPHIHLDDLYLVVSVFGELAIGMGD